jgi:hypothetical protein
VPEKSDFLNGLSVLSLFLLIFSLFRLLDREGIIQRNIIELLMVCVECFVFPMDIKSSCLSDEFKKIFQSLFFWIIFFQRRKWLKEEILWNSCFSYDDCLGLSEYSKVYLMINGIKNTLYSQTPP